MRTSMGDSTGLWTSTSWSHPWLQNVTGEQWISWLTGDSPRLFQGPSNVVPCGHYLMHKNKTLCHPALSHALSLSLDFLSFFLFFSAPPHAPLLCPRGSTPVCLPLPLLQVFSPLLSFPPNKPCTRSVAWSDGVISWVREPWHGPASYPHPYLHALRIIFYFRIVVVLW